MLPLIRRLSFASIALACAAVPASAQFTPYCFGDGTGAACPCLNTGAIGNGCANFLNPNGANLTATGFPSLSADTMLLTLTGATTSTTARFFQATLPWNYPNGLPIWDGLRCINGTVIILKNAAASGGSAVYPASGDLPISIKGQIFAVGTTRYYQCRYSDTNTFCTPASFNMTNAVSTVWLP
jgi:hypothetical protein